MRFRYVIVGGGLAGVSAVDGIRSRDADGSVLLLGRERALPYDRPPLTKELWNGKKKVEEIFLHPAESYAERRVDLTLGTDVVSVDPARHEVTDSHGLTIGYEKLLLATGGEPRRLKIPGGDLPGIFYYRRLEDYRRLRAATHAGATAVVIGGGFIGSEIAAALTIAGAAVTMIFPDAYLVSRIVPESLGRALSSHYEEKGVRILAGDRPSSIERDGEGFVTRTAGGETLHSDLVIAGVGIEPEIPLARAAGLTVDNGVVVDEFLRTSSPDIYAAGDIAFFPCAALEQRMRLEHWDNARSQGECAGRNMSGAGEAFTYLPFFFSDLFEFGYEAVGDVSAALETRANWKKVDETGVVYYLKDGRVRGVMTCNVFGQLDAARALIAEKSRHTPGELRGRIPVGGDENAPDAPAPGP